MRIAIGRAASSHDADSKSHNVTWPSAIAT